MDGAALLPYNVIATCCFSSAAKVRNPLWYLYLRNKLTNYTTTLSLKLCRPVQLSSISYDPTSASISFLSTPPIAVDNYYQRFKRYWICCQDSSTKEFNFYRGFFTSADLTSVISAYWCLAPPTKKNRNK